MENYTLLYIALVILAMALLLFLKRSRGSVQQQQDLAIRLARAEQQVESLGAEKLRLLTELEQERGRRSDMERSFEASQAHLKAQQDRIAEQRLEMEQVKIQFNKDFELIANKILEEKTRKFTETNQQALDQLLHPLKENIKAFEEKVDKTYKAESDERNILKGVVELLVEQSKHIQNEANSLSRALRGDSKKQGNWGEVILERVLERSGLEKDREYRLQASLLTDDGRRLQPDAIIDLPDDKQLVIDSKVSLLAYERWVSAETEEEKSVYARQHVVSVRNHVMELSAKKYHDLYQINSPEFVLLFMPIEPAFSMAVTHHADLFSEAWERKVVIVSPSTLLATLRTIASMWKQERQTRNVLEIAREAGALYDKFAGFVEDLDKMEKQIGQLFKTHEEARKKLQSGRGNILSKVEKLRMMGARTNKRLDKRLPDDEEETEDPG